MAYKACFACELLFEVDPVAGESTRCPQCGGVLSDYDPSADELDGNAEDVAPAPTQANQAIVRTMSYKGLADAVKAQIGNASSAGSIGGSGNRPQPRGRGPVPRARTSGSSGGRSQPRSAIPARPAPRSRTGGLIPAQGGPARPRPVTDEIRSMAGEFEDEHPRPHTSPIGSLDMHASELHDDPPPMARPAPAPLPARPAPVPVPARPAAAPVAPAAPAQQGTKVLDAVGPDDDATALDAAGAAVLSGVDDSMVDDISMQSMHEDPSFIEDISMQSMIEPIPEAEPEAGGYDLPATVALQQDPNRPLPPIPGMQPAAPAPAMAAPVAPAPASPFGAAPAPAPASPFGAPRNPTPAMGQPAMPEPAMPQPAMPQPAMPRPAQAMPLATPQPAMPQPAMPQPVAPRPAMPQPIAPRAAAPQPGSPFGVAPAAPIAPASPMGRGDDEISTGASAFAVDDFDAGVARKGRSKLPLIIALVVVVLGAVGAAVWFFVLREPDAPPVVEEPPPPELTWSEKLEQQIQAGQGALPTVDAAAPLPESTWIAGGPEGMSTSLGLVTGMATTVIREGAAQTDEAGAWLPMVQKKLSEGTPGADTALLLALPADMTLVDFLRLADSGRRAGHGAFAMVVEEGAGSGKLSALPFVLAPKNAPLPEKGIVKVGIGKLGLHITARDAQNKRLPEGQAEGEPDPEPRVAMKDGALDLDGFAARLAALKAAQPDIERVVIQHAPEMKVGELAPLLARIYQGSEGKRFAETALVP